jgi:hypothetical protein
MPTQQVHRPVPREFVGRAREYRRTIIAAEAEYLRVRDAIVRPLESRLERRHIKFRQQSLIDVARRLRAVNLPGRLDFSVDLVKGRLAISDYRVGACSWVQPEWLNDDRQPGCLVTELRTRADDQGLLIDGRPLLSVSLHALARWYQRSRGAVLTDDLVALLQATRQDRGAADGPGMRVLVGSAAWLCMAMPMTVDGKGDQRFPVTHVSTYLGPHEVHGMEWAAAAE